MFELVLSEYMRTMLRGDLKRCLSNSHLTRRSKIRGRKRGNVVFSGEGLGKGFPKKMKGAVLCVNAGF